MTSRPRLRTRGPRNEARGFTLIEILTTLLVLSVAMLLLSMVLQSSVVSRFKTMQAIEARTKASAAIELIASDLRGAGSGVDAGYSPPQPAIAYVDSLELMLCGDFSGAAVAPIDTLAYNPSGTPKPFKLTGAFAPPIKYRTGAELIRWTLDLNNDGMIDTLDVSDANGVDVRRTPNPNDFMLVRQIYGDSLNDVAGDNGGAISRIAPIRKPGNGIAPLFTVTFTDGTTWNWSSGAVPANKLASIASITIRVTAESARPDPRGCYAQVTLSTTVSLRRFS